MLPNSAPQKLFLSIYTLSELQHFYKELDTIISNLFKTQDSVETVLEQHVGAEKKDLILSYLAEQKIDSKNLVGIQDALLKLKTDGNKIPVINLTLAFEPTNAVLKNICLWFMRNTNSKVLLNVTLERQVLGGAYVSYDGYYKDYTLNKKIDDYFSKSKAHIEQ